MTTRDPRRRRRFVPLVTTLETRRLLSFIAFISQDGKDIVGPDASQGPDGIVDLHMSLASLASSNIASINIQGPSGFESQTEPDPNGYALAEFFSTGLSAGDLYINPQVKSNTKGSLLSPGSSTGNLIQLQNYSANPSMILNLTVVYTDAPKESYSVNVSGLTTPLQTISYTAPPSVTSGFTVSDQGQDNSGLTGADLGDVHLTATAPSGVTFNTSTFAQVTWKLSDLAGEGWGSNNTNPPGRILAALEHDAKGNGNVVDLYFPQHRDESPPSGSAQNTLTLMVTGVSGSSNVYETQFQGTTWDPTKVVNGFNGNSSPPISNETDLRRYLSSTNPEYDTINLATNQTITIAQPIQITHPVKFVGNGATLLFQQGNSGAWPLTASGAIYVSNPTYTNISVELDSFTIQFASTPLVWQNPQGDNPANWDPNNDLGITHAVIDTSAPQDSNNRQLWKLSGMTISGPPAWDASTYSTWQATLDSNANNYQKYVGESPINLVLSNTYDTGSITNCTFTGGPVSLSGGPWVVTGNTHLGAVLDTFSGAAFSFEAAHDVTLRGNTVSQSAFSASIFRLVNFASSGWNNTVEDNSFEGGAGAFGGEVRYNAKTQALNGVNDPEVMLEENNVLVFAGRPGAISADGRTLLLPNVRDNLAVDTGPGLVVSILSGVNADGSPNMTLAGQWFRVAQQVATSPYPQFLMQDPLPPMPAGGYYLVEVTPGFVNSSFINNTINLTNRSSAALKVDGENFDLRVLNNTITGGYGTYTNTHGLTTYFAGTAMLIGAGANSQATQLTAQNPNPLPNNWTVLTTLDALIIGNTIVDSPNGVIIGVEHSWGNISTGLAGSSSETGRVYLTASVVGNTFSVDQAFLTGWYTAFTSGSLGNALPPQDSDLPPSVTVGAGSGAMANATRLGVRSPWWVGGYDAFSNPNQPIFVDPVENVVIVQGNKAQTVQSDGTIFVRTEGQSQGSGQVYAGTINGQVRAPSITEESFNGAYFAYDQGNMGIAAQTPCTTGIQALMLGQDNYDLIGAGNGTPAPDTFQDLHIQLTGLDPGSTPLSVEVIGTASSGEDWKWPMASGYPQMIFDWPAGSTTADILLGATTPHLDDNFTFKLTYANGGPITVPIQGVLFNPTLPVLPAAPQAPLNLSAVAANASQINLAWNATPGAAQYVVERNTDQSTWTVLANNITTLTYADTSGLVAGTTYYYLVRATSASLVNSPNSAIASATVTDTLTASAVSIGATEGYSYNGPVATFRDTNQSASASQFTATINWGDGVTTAASSITGGAGNFTVGGTHTYSAYSAPNSFPVLVSISMMSGSATASTTSDAIVQEPYVPVDLSSYYTEIGITDVNSTVQPHLTSGSESYSSAYLTGSVSMGPFTFSLGAPNVNDEVPMGGQNINVPAGNYSAAAFLATTTGYWQSAGGTFRLDYTTGPSETYTQGLSDWKGGYSTPGTTAPGETIIGGASMPNCNTYTSGHDQPESPPQPVFIYGFVIHVDPTRTLMDVALFNNANMKLFALDLSLQPAQVNLAGYYNALGITTPGGTTRPSFDSGGDSYSSTALGATLSWNSQSFNLGPADASDVVIAGGQSISISPGSYTGIELLGTTAGYNQTVGDPFRVDYTNGTSDSYILGVSDWITGYTGTPGSTAPGEAIAQTMNTYNAWVSGQDKATPTNVDIYGYFIPVDPTRTPKDLALPNENKIKILAMNLVYQPPQVNLGYALSPATPAFNEIGITTAATNLGGIDAANDSYSGAALGNSIVWNGQTFNIGPAATKDAVTASGTTITLPQGHFTALDFLGADTSGSAETVIAQVNYADGTNDTFSQSFSDWMKGYTGIGGTTAPGESIVPGSPMGTYNKSSGPASGNVYLYGYAFRLNPAKVVSSVQFPSGSYHVNILAIDEVSQPAQVNLGHGTNQASSPFSEVGITSSTDPGAGHFDSAGDSYVVSSSGNNDGLGNTVVWNGQTFNIGPANVGTAGSGNEVPLGGRVIYLTPGKFSSLQLLGAAVNGHSEPTTIYVFYTDNTYETFNQTFSDWRTGYNGTLGSTAAGESIARAMTAYDTPTGKLTGNVDLYGYVMPLNASKTVSYMTEFNDNAVKLLAIDEVYQPAQVTSLTIGDAGFENVSVGTGNYRYNPADAPYWTFSGQSGISANNSGFTSGNPPAPDGSQVAFLQGTGSFSQTVAGWAAGSYTLTFYAAQRGTGNASQQNFNVLVDGVVVGTVTPSGKSYQRYTVTFDISVGTHTIAFQGLDSAGGDNTALIDSVLITH